MKTREKGTAERKSSRILVVDDEAAILETFQVLLSRDGNQVDTASTGRAALEKVENKQYDLAVIDIKLPDMDGTEVLRELRTKSPRMRKVMITGYPSIDSAIASVNFGAHAYLVKPVKPEDFLEIVHLKLRELEEERSFD